MLETTTKPDLEPVRFYYSLQTNWSTRYQLAVLGSMILFITALAAGIGALGGRGSVFLAVAIASGLAFAALVHFLLSNKPENKCFIELSKEGLRHIRPKSLAYKLHHPINVELIRWQDIAKASLTETTVLFKGVPGKSSITFTNAYKDQLYTHEAAQHRPVAGEPDIRFNLLEGNHAKIVEAINRFHTTYGDTQIQGNSIADTGPVTDPQQIKSRKRSRLLVLVLLTAAAARFAMFAIPFIADLLF